MENTDTQTTISPRETDLPRSSQIVLDKVTKVFKRGRQRITVLSGISLNIRKGEFVAITGASGSGKSTLLQLIGGLDRPTSGDIVIDSININSLRDRKLSHFRNQTIGFVFQFFYLQPFLNLRKNVAVPSMFAKLKTRQRDERVAQLLEQVDLSGRAEHYPHELSGGQTQRAAIARALVNQPKILLADEPTGNLDSTNSQEIIELFHSINRQLGVTVVVVTHDQNIAASADREIKLSDGAIV